MTNKQAFEKWASTHVLQKICFFWDGDNSELTLHNRTYNDAIKVAEEFGWREPRWFKPWTWSNGVITVG